MRWKRIINVYFLSVQSDHMDIEILGSIYLGGTEQKRYLLLPARTLT